MIIVHIYLLNFIIIFQPHTNKVFLFFVNEQRKKNHLRPEFFKNSP